MEDFDLTLSLNGEEIPVKVHTHIEGDKTNYDVIFENFTVCVYKNTLYTWTTDNSNGLNQADIQSIGEQIQDV
ncbi:MAG: hypothetical protein JWQ25_436 [Daejeonella sp.]|nr:hypothetical protein [Daejeonella sp.]